MATPTYRADRVVGEIIYMIFIVLLTLALFICVAHFLPSLESKFPGVNVGWFLLAPLVIPMGIVTIVDFTRQRRRRKGIQEQLQSLGFQAEMPPTTEQSTDLWNIIQPMTDALQISGTSKNIPWLGHKASDDPTAPKCWFFEYTYYTGTGKRKETRYCTIALWPTDLPGLPGTVLGHGDTFWMGRLGFFERWFARKTALPAHTISQLGEQWTLRGNPATGHRFINPMTLWALKESPKGECWSFGNGWVACIFKHRLNGRNLRNFYERGQQLLTESRE